MSAFPASGLLLTGIFVLCLATTVAGAFLGMLVTVLAFKVFGY